MKPSRKDYWFKRGYDDGRSGKGYLCFDNAPSHWSASEVTEAWSAYNDGFNEGSIA